MQSNSTFLPKMPAQQVRGPPAPRGPQSTMLTVMTDLPPLNGPPAPRGPPRPMLNGPPAPRAQRAQRPMLAVTTDHPYVPEVVWIPRHALLQYPNRKKCIAKSK